MTTTELTRIEAERLYTDQEAARLLSVSPWTIGRMRRSGEVRVVRRGKLVRVSGAELLRWIGAHERAEKWR